MATCFLRDQPQLLERDRLTPSVTASTGFAERSADFLDRLRGPALQTQTPAKLVSSVNGLIRRLLRQTEVRPVRGLRLGVRIASQGPARGREEPRSSLIRSLSMLPVVSQ